MCHLEMSEAIVDYTDVVGRASHEAKAERSPKDTESLTMCHFDRAKRREIS